MNRGLIASLLLALGSARASAENWRPVDAAAIRALFSGKEFTDGAHFSYRFAPDRSFAGTELGKDVRGRWRIEGRRMCWRWTSPPGEEECYDVERDGSEIRLLKNGAEAWYGRTLPMR